MKRLNLYVGESLLITTALAVGILTFVMISASLLQAFELLSRGISLGVFGRFVLLTLPFALQFTLPLALLCSTILVFSRLSADREITAMWASGISLWQIVSPALLLAVAVSAVCFYLQNYLAPEYSYRAALLKRGGAVENPIAFLDTGRYVELPGYVIYVGERNGSRLEDIQIYVLDDAGRVSQDAWAAHGTIAYDAARELIDLRLEQAVFGVVGQPGTGERFRDVQRTQAQTISIPISRQDAANRKRVMRKVKHMDLRALLTTIHIFEQTGQPTTPLYLEMHKRMSLAFSPLGFILMGIPFGIRTRRTETSVGLVISLVLALVYYVFLALADSLHNQAGLHPEVLVWIPNILYQVGGIVALQRLVRK